MKFEWYWFAIPLAFILGFIFSAKLVRYRQLKKTEKVNRGYFQGLNFLLNEQPDKAIEVFIKALEVDSETVELHLALGGLFRRKGEVDRAIRVHQNLIARPSLSETQRLQSVYELAQDYYKAGLLDRAESLFLELKESGEYQQLAVEGLLKIYQQEKEWQKAIKTIRQLKRGARQQQSQRSAHYWSELAEVAIESQNFEDARKYLHNALSDNRNSKRAVLLQGELAYQKNEYGRALEIWQGLSSNHPDVSELVVDKIIHCYQMLNDQKGLKKYLRGMTSLPKMQNAFNSWLSTFEQTLGVAEARQVLFDKLSKNQLNNAAVDHLLYLLKSKKLPAEQQEFLVNLSLKWAKDIKFEYTCNACGYEVRALYWHCPNCAQWDSFESALTGFTE